MHWLISFLLEHKHGSSLFLTVLLSLLLLNSTDLSQQHISRVLTTSLFSPAQLVVNSTQKVRNFLVENKALQEQVVALQMANASLRHGIELDSLEQRIITLSDTLGYNLISAEVVGVEPSPHYTTVVVNVGRAEGIRKSMPVVAPQGVVGRIIRVMERSALVQLIRQPDVHVSVMHEKSRAVGILSADGSGTLLVHYRNHEAVAIGDTLITSGFGGIFPPELPVGLVSKIETAEMPLFREVYVQPFVQFDRLRFLSVVDIESRWEAFAAEIDTLIAEEVE